MGQLERFQDGFTRAQRDDDPAGRGDFQEGAGDSAPGAVQFRARRLEDGFWVLAFGDEPGDKMRDVVDDRHRGLGRRDSSGDFGQLVRLRSTFRLHDREPHRVEGDPGQPRSAARAIVGDGVDRLLNRFGQHVPSARGTPRGP